MTSKIPGLTCAKWIVFFSWIIFLRFTWRVIVYVWSEKDSQTYVKTLNGIFLGVWVIMVSMNILLTVGVFLADASILQHWIKLNVAVLASLAIALISILTKTETYHDAPGLILFYIGLMIWMGGCLFAIIYFRTGIIEGEADNDTSEEFEFKHGTDTSNGTNCNSDESSLDVIV